MSAATAVERTRVCVCARPGHRGSWELVPSFWTDVVNKGVRAGQLALRYPGEGNFSERTPLTAPMAEEVGFSEDGTPAIVTLLPHWCSVVVVDNGRKPKIVTALDEALVAMPRVRIGAFYELAHAMKTLSFCVRTRKAPTIRSELTERDVVTASVVLGPTSKAAKATPEDPVLILYGRSPFGVVTGAALLIESLYSDDRSVRTHGFVCPHGVVWGI